MITFISSRKTRSFRQSLWKIRKAKRKTRRRANTILNFAIVPLASLGTTEGGQEGGLEVDRGGEEGTILAEGIVGGTMLPGHKPLLHLHKKATPYLFNPPTPLLTSQMTGQVITREYTINLHTTR